MGFYYLYLTSKDYQKNENEDKPRACPPFPVLDFCNTRVQTQADIIFTKISSLRMKIKKMKNSKTTKKKWELKMKEKEPLQ